MKIDFKDPSVQKTVIVLLVGVFVLYIFNSQIYSKKKEVLEELNKEYNELNAQYINAKRTASSLPMLEEENKRLTRRWESLKKILPEEKDLPGLIDEISKAGYHSNLVFKSFIPQKVDHRAFYDESSYKVRVAGGYHDLGIFFSRLGAMERIIKVSDLKIEPNKEAGTPEQTIAAEFIVRTYVLYKGGERAVEEGN
jgi:type IV pilus assembly protein PilO